MKKSQATEILKQCPASTVIRMTICNAIHMELSAAECLAYLTKTTVIFEDDNSIQLESKSFEFALAYNSVINAAIAQTEMQYTKEQEYEMWSMHYEHTSYAFAGRRYSHQ